MSIQANIENHGEPMPNLLTVVNNDIKRQFEKRLSHIEEKVSKDNKLMYEDLRKGLEEKVDERHAVIEKRLNEVQNLMQEKLNEGQNLKEVQKRIEERQSKIDTKLDEIIRRMTSGVNNQDQGQLNQPIPVGVVGSSSASVAQSPRQIVDDENNGKLCTSEIISSIIMTFKSKSE